MYPTNGGTSISDSRNWEEEQYSDRYGQSAATYKERQKQKRKGNFF